MEAVPTEETAEILVLVPTARQAAARAAMFNMVDMADQAAEVITIFRGEEAGQILEAAAPAAAAEGR